MSDQFSRTRLLIGERGLEKLRRSHIIVFGLGGVGGFAAEALARAGIGALSLVDNDVFRPSNLNRQLHALQSTLGEYKVSAAMERIALINKACSVKVHKTFFLPENSGRFDFSLYDYVVDAIDTVSGKIALIMKALESGVPVISCMGAGNKLDASAFRAADIYETSVCPLARVMRRELKSRGVKALRVVYSAEQPLKLKQDGNESENRRQTPGSISFVPAAAGLICAGEVVRGLLSL
jgi:tRNA A37 threonylcarbamoyladenosine dehydratase